MRRLLALLGLSVSFVALAPAVAESCSCMGDRPPCAEAWISPLVFAGTVIAVDQEPNALGPRRVRLRVTEAFRGTEKGEIDIHLRGGGGPSCDPPFRMGEAWLVYGGNRPDGPGWTASSCSRTQPLSHAAEDLAYLRIPDKDKPPSQVYGRVTRHVRDLSLRTPGEYVPVPDVTVTVTSGSSRLEVKTDSDGRYAVPIESHDFYQVDFARHVGGLSIRGSEQVRLQHHRACAVVDARAIYDGRVVGQVVDDRGRPVPFMPITLASSPRLLQQHMLTDAAGRFEFAEVYPAEHDVVPSISLWQGSRALPPLTPTPLHVGPSARVDAGPLALPASMTMALVEIRIEDSTGKAAAGAYVTLRLPDEYGRIEYAPEADHTGIFRVSLVAGQRYRVEASHTREAPTGAVYETGETVFEATALKPIRLRLARSR